MNTVATVYVELVPQHYVGGIGITISCKKTDLPEDLRYRLEQFLISQGYSIEKPLFRKEG